MLFYGVSAHQAGWPARLAAQRIYTAGTEYGSFVSWVCRRSLSLSPDHSLSLVLLSNYLNYFINYWSAFGITIVILGFIEAGGSRMVEEDVMMAGGGVAVKAMTIE